MIIHVGTTQETKKTGRKGARMKKSRELALRTGRSRRSGRKAITTHCRQPRPTPARRATTPGGADGSANDGGNQKRKKQNSIKYK
jgi:hypothetical protein